MHVGFLDLCLGLWRLELLGIQNWAFVENPEHWTKCLLRVEPVDESSNAVGFLFEALLHTSSLSDGDLGLEVRDYVDLVVHQVEEILGFWLLDLSLL